jgi:hypothetical protein
MKKNNDLLNDWSLIDEPIIIPNKWNLIESLSKKDKMKINISNIYNNIINIYPYLSIFFTKNNNYINIISQSVKIINNNILNNYSKETLKNIQLQYNYNIALKQAYLQMLNICYNLCYNSLIEINKYKNFKYLKEIIIEDINEQFIIISNNYKYIFIYYHFLLNISFQNDLQKIISDNINNIKLTFDNNDKLNKFTIIIFYDP